MNAEIKKKWLKALRSGKYKQTTGVLHNNSGYCCLGVLCEVVIGPEKIEWERREASDFYSLLNGACALPPVSPSSL